MEQARNYVCKQCASPVPAGHKFCGGCGAGVPESVQTGDVDFFGVMQTPGKARLILIRGDQEGMDGVNYALHSDQHIAGREQEQIIFPEDTWLSPRHANFFYEGDRLVVRDEGSTNGVYLRITQPVQIAPGDQFLCGDQLFRLEENLPDTSGPADDQTYFYSSPKRPAAFRVIQTIVGGVDGLVHCARENSVMIGREDTDINFPEDIYMSGQHARVENAGGQFILTDLDSRNGTYVRINGQADLKHGDYLFLGKQLLRVEVTE